MTSPPTASSDVIIQTPDLEAATAFYEKMLGLTVFERSSAIVGFDAGGFRLFVEPGPLPGPVFEFLVDDVEAARTMLLAQGCRILAEDPAVPRCYVQDPFGLAFNLARRP